MMKGLMDRCIAREKLVDHLKERVETAERWLHELEAWKEVQLKKLDVTKKALEEMEGHAEALKNVLKDKEGKISILRRTRKQSFLTSMPSFTSSAATMLTVLTSASVKSRLSSLTWTCLRSPLTSWPKPQPNPLSLKVPTSCLRLTPFPTLEVTKRPLYKKNRLSIKGENHPLKEAKTADHEKVVDKEALLTSLRFCKFYFYFIIEIM